MGSLGLTVRGSTARTDSTWAGSVRRKIAYDREYITRAGLRTDGRILLSTVSVVLTIDVNTAPVRRPSWISDPTKLPNLDVTVGVRGIPTRDRLSSEQEQQCADRVREVDRGGPVDIAPQVRGELGRLSCGESQRVGVLPEVPGDLAIGPEPQDDRPIVSGIDVGEAHEETGRVRGGDPRGRIIGPREESTRRPGRGIVGRGRTGVQE